MNKEQMKDEIILAVKEAFNDNAEPTPFVRAYIELDGNDIDHIAEQTAENLYNAGYRKTFTSDLASDTQKAYKEGYIKGAIDRDIEIAELKAENERLTEKLRQVLLSIDTVKEMNAMCNIDEQIKQAVKEFAERLKMKTHNYYPSIDSYCISKKAVLVSEIDELLKEYEQ